MKMTIKSKTHHLSKLSLLVIIVFVLMLSCKKKTEETIQEPIPPVDTTYYKGMDLSFQPEIKDWNTPYFDADNTPVELLPFLKLKGVNLVRLKLWHTPDTTYNGLYSVIEYAKQVKQNGMALLIDFHYSDTWADPGKQFVPQAWEGLEYSQVNDSIYVYTKAVIERMKAENVMPDMVQIGNETNSGMLWDYGKVGEGFNENWPNYTSLIKSAVKGINDIEGTDDIQIILHFAGYDGAEWFFDNIESRGVDYDIIGLSFYSIWHGNSLNTLQIQLNSISNKYKKKIMIVETAYPFTLDWNDNTNNFWGDQNQLISGYPATPEGQKAFLTDLNNVIKSISGNRGMGYCYWAPDWIAFKGQEATNGSVWENATVFDFEAKALPITDAF
jgi:arabinogalactan endo-1,4-beta-galactosidase